MVHTHYCLSFGKYSTFLLEFYWGFSFRQNLNVMTMSRCFIVSANVIVYLKWEKSRRYDSIGKEGEEGGGEGEIDRGGAECSVECLAVKKLLFLALNVVANVLPKVAVVAALLLLLVVISNMNWSSVFLEVV